MRERGCREDSRPGKLGERGADIQIFIRFETRTPHTNVGSEPEQRAQRRREVESRNFHKPQTQWTDSQRFLPEGAENIGMTEDRDSHDCYAQTDVSEKHRVNWFPRLLNPREKGKIQAICDGTLISTSFFRKRGRGSDDHRRKTSAPKCDMAALLPGFIRS